MNNYAIYLRKSRADLDAEARGEGETLARHRRALTEFAANQGYYVEAIYEEIVTGDSISARPQMQILLGRVQNGDFAGVIVNDVDRLGRGDSIDQGIIKQSFYSTNTLIITPRKTYDPAVESDEDGFEFSLFFARYEYRQITRRMYTGRCRSAQEGNYTGARPAYGFNKVRVGGKLRLVQDPETAPVALLMLGMLIDEKQDVYQITAALNRMGYRTRNGQKFTPEAVRAILRNPALAGHTLSRKTCTRTVIQDGTRIKKRMPNAMPLLVQNTHQGICTQERFDTAQAILDHNEPRLRKSNELKNPLAGLIVCAECGRIMALRGGNGRTLTCPRKGCATTGIDASLVENAILDTMKGWVHTYAAPNAVPDYSAEFKALASQLDGLNRQMDKLYDLVEQGVYTTEDFVRRRADLQDKIAAIKAKQQGIQTGPTKEQQIVKLLPRIRRVLEAYPMSQSTEERNQLLKLLLIKVDYRKTRKVRRGENPADYLELDLFPRRDG